MSAKKRRKLPFVVEPRFEPITERIGNDELGVIEIRRQGYLTVAEKAFIQAANQGDGTFARINSIAHKISERANCTPNAVLDALQSGDLDPVMFDGSEEELAEIVQLMTIYNEKAGLINATAMIVYRLDPSWTMDDSLEMHPSLVAQLSALCQDEEAKNTDVLHAYHEERNGEEASVKLEEGKE